MGQNRLCISNRRPKMVLFSYFGREAPKDNKENLMGYPNNSDYVRTDKKDWQWKFGVPETQRYQTFTAILIAV
jgi:hypothetical protein